MVSVADIYHELTAQGASTIQALGIMANMINESGFNPEAVGDQGTSFGLVQQHGSYGYLVTGDATADMKRQIQTLKGLGGFAAASGNTPQDAAGNFAANYERCVGCQQGGSQWQSRVANATTVVGYFKSGKWPQVGGGGAASSPGGSGTVAQTAQFTSYWSDTVGAVEHPWELFSQAVGDVWKGVTSPVSAGVAVGDSLSQLAKGFTELVGLFDRLLHVVEWLFVPSHWVRIFAFGGGLLFALPGAYALMRAGQGSGDISLALGIFLIMIAGILFFVAFHNIPDDVSNLQTLLQWLSEGIRTGRGRYLPVYGGGEIGPSVQTPPGGDFSGGSGANSFS